MKKMLSIACSFIMMFMIAICTNFRTVEKRSLENELKEKVNINSESSITEVNTNINQDVIPINIIIGDSIFIAEFKNNEATKELINKFPLTIKMEDLNKNEKYYNFLDNISNEKGERPKTINAGDIMVWSGNCLVLFYETFQNSYGGYDSIGSIKDIQNLKASLGNNSVDVIFSVTE